jgi:hypothetical protein
MDTNLNQGPPTSAPDPASVGLTDVAAATAPQSAPSPAPAAAPAPQKPSLWRNVVAGALAGLANSAGSTSFGSGLGKGAAGELARQQQEKDNAAQNKAQELANQKQMDEHQRSLVDVAHTQAMIAQAQRQTLNLPPDYQTKIAEGRADQTEKMRQLGAMSPAGTEDTTPDHHIALQQVTALTQQNPGKVYSAEPIRGADGKIAYQAMQVNDAPLTEDVPLFNIQGKKIGVLPKGTSGVVAAKAQAYAATQDIQDMGAKTRIAQQNADSARISANAKAAAAANKTNPAALGPDALGFQPKMPVTGAQGYQKIAASFKKNEDDLAQTEQTYQQFADFIKDVDAGKDLTGAQSVVGLFNAIGISAEPLKGKGFRINNLTVAEHAGARGIRQSIEQKFGALKTGAIITPQQLKDYASIAEQVRQNKYVAMVNQAHNVGLNADPFLPTGNGQHIDVPTARIFLKLTGGNQNKAQQAAQKKGWVF